MENSERDGNTRTPDMPFEKSVCMSGNNREQFREEDCEDCLGYDGRAVPLWTRWGSISYDRRTIAVVSRVK